MDHYEEEIKEEQEKLRVTEEMLMDFRLFLYQMKQKYPQVLYYSVSSKIPNGTAIHRVYLNKETYAKLADLVPQLSEDSTQKAIQF